MSWYCPSIYVWYYQRVHVYEALNFSGEPKETEEMKPQWFTEDNIPYDSM